MNNLSLSSASINVDVTGTLNILSWNANCLNREKASELEIILKEYQIDIALISETWFTKESKLFFKNYNMYNARHPSNNTRGGASLLIRNTIKHNLISLIENDRFQAVIVSVSTSLGAFNVTSLYSPPKLPISVFQYDNLLNKFGSKFLAGGDWNSKNVRWGSRIITPRGQNLNESVTKFAGDFLSPFKPTFYPHDKKKKPDIIDFFIFKNVNLYEKTTCDVLPDFEIDHAPVLLNIYTHPILIEKPTPLVNKNTDWKGFRKYIEEKLDHSGPNTVNIINDPDTLDVEVEYLVKIIIEAAKNNTKVAVNNQKPFNLPKGLLDLISKKREARRTWFRTRYEEDREVLNRLIKVVQNRLKKYRFEKFEKFVKALSPSKDNDYSLWKATKYLKRPAQSRLPIRKGDGSWANTSQEKADLLANHFENVFQPNEGVNDEFEKEKILKIPSLKIKNISLSELKEEIRTKIKVKKAPGEDGITGIILKQLPVAAIKKLTDIFNAVFKLKYIPKQWKRAEVIVLNKPGKPSEDPGSYRPISLLPAIGKLFERLYIKRLKKIVGDRKLIIDSQFGFRDKHSTIEQLHRVTSYIDEALEKKEFCVAVFLDIKQAFDKVYHKKLIFKLYKMLPQNHVELLSSYLSDRYFRIRFEDAFSSYRSIKAGVPQGSVISPLLYSLFTADIPSPRAGGKMGIFADDTLTMASSPEYYIANEMVQEHLIDIQKWTADDGTKLNETKSVEVVFTNRNYVHIPLILNNIIIPNSNSSKYLGLTLDSKLRWQEHIKKKQTEVNLKFNKMRWLFGRRSKLPRHIKTLLYKVMIRPIWSYGCVLWGCAANSNIKIIETIQNKILREIANAQWYQRNEDIRSDLNVESVEEVIVKLASTYEHRLHFHPNPEAIELLDTSEKVRRLKRRKPLELTTMGFKKL